jgi:hypothetical protein
MRRAHLHDNITRWGIAQLRRFARNLHKPTPPIADNGLVVEVQHAQLHPLETKGAKCVVEHKTGRFLPKAATTVL